MKLKIEIKMDSASFEPDNGTEAARILRDLAEELDGGHYPAANWAKPLCDINGNEVGKAKVTQ